MGPPVPSASEPRPPVQSAPQTRPPVQPAPDAGPPVPPAPQAGPPVRPAPEARRVDGHGHRRRWLAIALVAALAVAAALLIPFLLDRDDDQAAPAQAAVATPQPTETTPSPDTPIPPPAGFRVYRDPAGWSIAVPDAWTATRRVNAVTFTGDDRTLRVAERPNPPKDPYEAALARQPVVRSATPGYDLIRIASVTYRGWPTADWEYRAGTTARTHSLIRSTVPSRRQVFDISWTCLDRSWTADKRFFDTAVRTFDPGA